ncbi:MAG: DUF6089 family protein [Sphingobacteriaceae bacterium]
MRISLITLFLLISALLKAQTWEIGAFGGGSAYQGDLNQRAPLKITDMALGGYVKRNFNGYFAAKLNYGHGKIQADDRNSSHQQLRDRNLRFYSPIDELSIIGEFNFFNYVPEIGRNRFSPFIFLGLGLLNFNPQTRYEHNVYELSRYATEGQPAPYPRSLIAIPYGAGAKYNFFGKWSIVCELGFRAVDTDFLDDVSGSYPDKAVLLNNISRLLSDRSGENTGAYIGTAGTQRGDFRKNDNYAFAGFTLSYTFVTRNCPAF